MNSSNPYERISQELSIKAIQVQSVIQLLQEGATVPFIARYRKEQTGSLDEVQIRNIQSRYEYLEQVEKRRLSILKALAELGINNPELIHQINHADLLSRLEDLYLPYKPKKKTRASLAREKGLQALADEILLQKQPVEAVWESFKNSATGLIEQEEALKGASDSSSDALLPPEASLKGVTTADAPPPLPIHALTSCQLQPISPHSPLTHILLHPIFPSSKGSSPPFHTLNTTQIHFNKFLISHPFNMTKPSQGAPFYPFHHTTSHPISTPSHIHTLVAQPIPSTHSTRSSQVTHLYSTHS